MGYITTWFHGLWTYYRAYTQTRVGIHAAATAALTAFGLLAFIHRGFVALAIASYLLPPIYLYVRGDDAERRYKRKPSTSSGTGSNDTDSDGIDRDSDSDGADVDVDIDGTDADADADGIDADTDG